MSDSAADDPSSDAPMTPVASITSVASLASSAASSVPSRDLSNAPSQGMSNAPSREVPRPRSDYRHFSTVTTRWEDNDLYGHVNNVVYYSYFDTAVNRYLIGAGALDIHHGSVIGLVIETHCNYFAPLAFPQDVEAGVSVSRIGKSSVRYQIGLFAPGEPMTAAAGHFVHVYVDRATRRPVELPAPLRAALQALTVPHASH